MYRLALRKKKYVSWFATPIYTVFAAISKRRFLHRKKLSTSNLRYHPQQQKEVSTLTEGKIFVSLSPPVSMHTILIQASTFSTVWVKRGFYIGKIGEFQRNVPFPAPLPNQGAGLYHDKQKRGFYTGKTSYRNLYLCLHGKAFPLLQKSDFHTAQFVTATDSLQK